MPRAMSASSSRRGDMAPTSHTANVDTKSTCRAYVIWNGLRPAQCGDPNMPICKVTFFKQSLSHRIRDAACTAWGTQNELRYDRGSSQSCKAVEDINTKTQKCVLVL